MKEKMSFQFFCEIEWMTVKEEGSHIEKFWKVKFEMMEQKILSGGLLVEYSKVRGPDNKMIYR